MIRQAFKLIWNQRRKHLGLSFEIFFSFLVLFIVFSFGVYNLDKYISPLGYSYENLWTISLNREGTEKEKALEIDALISHHLKSYPEVDGFSFSSGNVPFAGGSTTSSLSRDNVNIIGERYEVDDQYGALLGVEVLEGRWFEKQDEALKNLPIILTKDAAALLFPEGSAVGKSLKFGEEGKEQKIIGITTNFRYRGGIREPDYGFFIRKKSDKLVHSLLIKVNDRASAAFEAKLMKNLHDIAPNYSLETKYLKEMREDFLLFSIIPMLVLGIIGTFLIFNVALGLFGVLWQNISQRRQEIGVRRAMGSTKSEITRQFILEIMVLATLSIVLGVFFAIQFPLLNVFEVNTGIYLLAIVFAIISIYLLVLICALIPSTQAAALHPAEALREE